MAGKAQTELENLLTMQSQGVAEMGHAQKLQEARQVHEFTQPREASFDTAGALSLAVGAGWLMGPAGGLLMGLAQGILGKRAQQNAIDMYARDMNVVGATNDIFNSELDRMALTTTNPDDLAQLSAMQTQKDAAIQLMSSASPELQEKGSSLLADFSTRMNDYSVRQEDQRIEAEAVDAENRRTMDAEQYSRYTTAISSFDATAAPYKAIMQATDVAMNALANGSPSDLWAANGLITKALAGGSAVVGDIGSLWDQGNTILTNALNGESISPENRRDLTGLLQTVRGTATKFMLAEEAKASDEINDIGLAPRFHDNFRVVENVPAVGASKITGTTLPLTLGFTPENIATNVDRALSTTSEDGTPVSIFAGAKKFLQGELETHEAEREASRLEQQLKDLQDARK